MHIQNLTTTLYALILITAGNFNLKILKSSVHVLPRPATEISTMMNVVFIPQQNSTKPIPTRIPKVNVIRKQNCLDAVGWLKENNERYNDITVSPEFLNEQVWDTEIEQTVPSDNLTKYIPSHAQKLGGNFEENGYEVRTANIGIHEVEEFSTSYLFTAPIADQSPSSIAIDGSRNTWLKHLSTGTTAVVHSDQIKEISNDMDWIIDCYPALFPEGRTGPSAARPVEMPFEKWITYWLNVYDSRYSKHYDFIFSLYNVIQRRKVIEQTR